MRLNVNEPWGNVARRYAKAYLDGEELKDCFEADEEAGVARCYVRDEKGHLKGQMTNRGMEPVVQERRGRVEIRFNPNTPPEILKPGGRR
jgi:hypothetical protein